MKTLETFLNDVKNDEILSAVFYNIDEVTKDLPKDLIFSEFTIGLLKRRFNDVQNKVFEKIASKYEEKSVLKKYVKRAYDIWENNRSKDFGEALTKLDDFERLAILTSTLNYQVGNGGFIQWFANGYGKYINAYVDAFSEVAEKTTYKPDVINYVIDLIERAYELYNQYEKYDAIISGDLGFDEYTPHINRVVDRIIELIENELGVSVPSSVSVIFYDKILDLYLNKIKTEQNKVLQKLSNLDEEYYAINAEFLTAIEYYLQKQSEMGA